MRLLSAASDPCPASSQNTRTHHVATSNRAAVACISRTHDQPQTHAHAYTTRQSDTPITLHSIRGPAAPHSLLSAALTWTSLSSSLYNHHHKNTRHTHTNTSRLFAPARPLFSPCSHSLVRSSFPLLLCKTSNKPTYCHYSAFSIVSMYTLLLLLSFVVSFSRREPPPPLTTSASPPSPPPTSASPPSPPPPP